MCTLDIHPMLHQPQICNPFAYEYPSMAQFYNWQRADSLEMVNVKEAQPPCCNRCQKMPCSCSLNGMVPMPPHLILPLEIRLQNYMNPIYPMDHNFLMQNPVYPMDHGNLFPYHNLPMMIPSNGPLLSPPSSASPPSPQSSPATNRPPKPARKFKCNVCDRTFHYKHVLQNHQRIHTGEKPFECQVCGNKFTRDHHLKTHMRLHTGEKPFPCTYCDMRFVQVANLRRHLRTHDPIPCDICDKRFTDLNALRRHSLEHNLSSGNVCDICHINHRPENDCPLRMNNLRISHANDIDDDSDAVSSGDSHTSNGSDQNAQYEETESIPEVLDLSTVVKNSTQSEPEDLSMKKYY